MVDAKRSFLHEGVLNFINKKGTLKEAQGFLFTDLLVVARRGSFGRYNKPKIIPFNLCTSIKFGIFRIFTSFATNFLFYLFFLQTQY